MAGFKLSQHVGGDGKYLKASDVPEGKELHLEIDRIAIEQVGEGSDQQAKAVCYFIGKERGLVLNRTNAEALIARYGDDTEAMSGQPILLFRTTTSFQGKTVPCLRLRAPAESAGADEVDF